MTLSAKQSPAFSNLPFRVYNRTIIILEVVALLLLAMLYISTRALYLFGLWLTPLGAVVLGVLTALSLLYAFD